MFYRCGPLVATIVVGSDDDSEGSLVWARSETAFEGGCGLVGDLHWHDLNHRKRTREWFCMCHICVVTAIQGAQVGPHYLLSSSNSITAFWNVLLELLPP